MEERFEWRWMASPLEEELRKYAQGIICGEDPGQIAEKASGHLDVWPFKDFSLRCWRGVSSKLLEAMSAIEKRYFLNRVQVAEMSGEDRTLLVTVLKVLQRILAYSKQRHPLDVSAQVMTFIYSMDLGVAVEAQKVLVFSLDYSMGLDEFPDDHDILLRCLGVNLDDQSIDKTLNLSAGTAPEIPEGLGDDVFGVLKEKAKEYGHGNLVFELRRRMYCKDVDGLNAMRVLGTCIFLVLAKGGGAFEEVVEKIDALEIRGFAGAEMSENMEFSVMSLLDILIYDEFDFSKVSRILELDNNNGFFYRRLARGFGEYVFERHMVFLVYNTLVANQRSKYLKMDVIMNALERFYECSPEVRYHFLRTIRLHCKDPSPRGVREFISRGGVAVLVEYLRHAEEYGVEESVNLKYSLKILGEIYMDGRNRMEVGSFEDSLFLDVTVATIRKLHLLDVRLVSLCIGILSSFMFDEPLNLPVFIEKGARAVLETLLSVDPTPEYVSAFISFIDAFSLNLEFQKEIVDGEHLFKLLVIMREEEFLGSTSSTSRMASLLGVLIMHHPVFRHDILRFYMFFIVYLKRLFEAEGAVPTGREHCIEVFCNFFSLVERMDVYPEAEDAGAFLDEVVDLIACPRYLYSTQNLLRGSFPEVCKEVYRKAKGSCNKVLERLVLDTMQVVEMGARTFHDGHLEGYPWEGDGEGDDHIDRMMLSYDNQMALASILCEEFMDAAEQGTKTRVFEAMACLYLMLVRLKGVFLAIDDLEEHRFSPSYRSVRLKLEEAKPGKDVRMHILQSVYLCNVLLLQKMYPAMVSASHGESLGFVRRLVQTCVQADNDSVVLALRLIEMLATSFGVQHYGVLVERGFVESILDPHAGNDRVVVVVSLLASRLSGRVQASPELRHLVLSYLRQVDIKSSGDPQVIELCNAVIEGVGKVFGGGPLLSDGEMDAILDVYERFHVSPLCEKLMIGGIVRQPRHTLRLVKIRAFSSFQHFLMSDPRVYRHGCFIVNRFFEYSDEFVEMASNVLLFATVGMCPHKIDVKAVGERVSGLVESDVLLMNVLFFLAMYFRLLGQLGLPKPHSLGLERLVSRVKTCDEMMLVRVLLSYAIDPSIEGVLDGVDFPPRPIRAGDEAFLKSHGFLMYRDYDMFVERCLRKAGVEGSVHFRHGCHRTCFVGEDCRWPRDLEADAEDVFIRKLVLMLDSQECFGLVVQLLGELVFNHPSLLPKICKYTVLDTVYERCVRKIDLSSKHRATGQTHWGVTLLVNGLHSQVFLSKLGGRRVDRNGGAGGIPSVCDFLLEKIRDGSSEDFLNVSFVLVRSLTPLFIQRYESEEDTTMERFRECSIFMGSAGVFEEMIRRIIAIEEGDGMYGTCIQHSLDYLGRVFRHCYGEILQDLDDYGDDESQEIEYYSIASEDQEFGGSAFGSEESYFDDSPFHDADSGAAGSRESGSSSGSEDVVMIKSIENDQEIPTTMYLLNCEYYSISAASRAEVEVAMSRKLRKDLIDKGTSCYATTIDGTEKNMSCELDNPDVLVRDPDNYADKEIPGEEHVDEEGRKAWSFEAADGSDVEESSGSNHGKVQGSESGDEESGSSESEMGSANGEAPPLDPEVLNAMSHEELSEALRAYFDERRARSLTYFPLATEFYARLSQVARPVFEEMEREYREGFFYDIRTDSVKESDEETIGARESLLEMDLETFERFVRKSIVEREFPFAKGWKLVDGLSKDTRMKRVVFSVAGEVVSSLAGARDGVDGHGAVKFRRSLCLLLSVVKSSVGYSDYFRESPGTVSQVFGILGKIQLTNDVLRLVTDFSTVFRKDKEFVFDRSVGLESILGCFGKVVDSECFNLLEEFIENTAGHFHGRFVDVILSEMRRVVGELLPDIGAEFPTSGFLGNQKVFLRLWKMLGRVLDGRKEADTERDEMVLGMMLDGFWGVFFSCQTTKESIEDLISVSDIYEAFFVVGKVFETQLAEGAPDAGRVEQCNEFRTFYKNMVEQQAGQINLLVDERPEKLFRNFNGLIGHSILTFGNKRKYLSRLLNVEGADKPSSFYRVYVDRGDVLRSSYFQVMAKSPEEFRTGRLEIKLAGEEGLDYGGLTREWLVLLAKDLLDQNFALFEFATEDKTTVVPCRSSYVNPEHLSYFKFVGRIVAKAIMDGNFIGLHLSKFIYKHILGKSCDLGDLESADPDFYRSLVWIRDNPVDESLGLTFSFDDVAFGAHKTVDLVEGGSTVFVSDSNKAEYIRLATQHRLFNGIELQLSALKSGLFEILGPKALEMFDENELELLICGVPDIDVDDWKSNTLYYGYTESSKTVIWFWKAVKSLDSVGRAKLLQFVTGTSTLPFEGFSHLQGNSEVQKFSIHKVSDRVDSLPTAHTCFNQLVLPEYSSYESLLRRLVLAINECSTGFGFI